MCGDSTGVSQRWNGSIKVETQIVFSIGCDEVHWSHLVL